MLNLFFFPETYFLGAPGCCPALNPALPRFPPTKKLSNCDHFKLWSVREINHNQIDPSSYVHHSHLNHNNIISPLIFSISAQKVPHSFRKKGGICRCTSMTRNVAKGRKVERTSAESIKVETVARHTSTAVVHGVNTKDSCILQVPSSPTSDGRNIIMYHFMNKIFMWTSSAMTLFEKKTN